MKLNITLFYLLSFVFIRLITRCRSLSLIVIFCYSLSFVIFSVIRCHSLLFVVTVPLVVTPYATRHHLLSFVVTCCTTRCHSLSLDVSLVCLFINDPKEYGRHQISSIYVFGFVSVWVGVFLLLFSIFLVELFLFLNATQANIFFRYEIFAIVYFVTFSLYSTFYAGSMHQQKIWSQALQ